MRREPVLRMRAQPSMWRAVLSILVAALAGGTVEVSAHTPHDDVFAVVAVEADAGQQGEFPRLLVLDRGVVLTSDDGGESWKRRLKGLANGVATLTSLTGPTAGGLLAAGSLGSGVLASRDHGDSWVPLGMQGPRFVHQVYAAPRGGRGIVAIDTAGRVHATFDEGGTWVRFDEISESATSFAYLDAEKGLVGTAAGTLYRVDLQRGSADRLGNVDESAPLRAITVLHEPSSMREADGRPQLLLGTDDSRVLSLVLDSPERGEQVARFELPRESGPILELVEVGGVLEDCPVLAISWRAWPVCLLPDGTWKAREAGLTTDKQAIELGRPFFSSAVPVRAEVGPGRVYLAGYDGLFMTTGGQEEWVRLDVQSMAKIVALTFSPAYEADGTLVYNDYVWGAYRSTNGGESWARISRDLYDPAARHRGLVRLFRVQFSPEFQQDRTLVTSTWYDFFVSDDAGRSWKPLTPFETEDGQRIDRGGLSTGAGGDDEFFFVTHEGHLIRLAEGRARVVLRMDDTVGAFELSPSYTQDSTIFVTEGSSLHIGQDSGERWVRHRFGDDSAPGEICAEAVYPEAYLEAWCAHARKEWGKESALKLAVSPAYAADGTLAVVLPRAVMITRDRGRRWQEFPLPDGVKSYYLESFAFSPAYPEDGTVLLNVRSRGLFLSRSDGAHWLELSPELAEGNVFFAQYNGMVPKYPSVLFSPQFAEDGRLFGFDGEQMYTLDVRSGDVRALTTPEIGWAQKAHASFRLSKQAVYGFLPGGRVGRYLLASLVLIVGASFVFMGYRRRVRLP